VRLSSSSRVRPIVIAGLLSVAPAGCGTSDPSVAATAGVSYRISTNDALTIDSVFYDDGHGTMVKVLNPAVNWSTTRSFSLPGSIEAHLYATAVGPASAKLHVAWTTADGDSSDSASNSIPGAGQFHVDLPHRAI
jgi:hypothetical protein